MGKQRRRNKTRRNRNKRNTTRKNIKGGNNSNRTTTKRKFNMMHHDESNPNPNNIENSNTKFNQFLKGKPVHFRHPHRRRLRKSTRRQSKYPRVKTVIRDPEHQGASKFVGRKPRRNGVPYKNQTYIIQKEPHNKQLKRRKTIPLICENRNCTSGNLTPSMIENKRKEFKNLEKEIELQRFLSKYDLAPMANSNFAQIESLGDVKYPLAAYYVEGKTALPDFDVKTTQELMMAFESLVEKSKTLIDEPKLGYMNIDMKEDNLVVDIGDVITKGPNSGSRSIKTFFIDTSPTYFMKLVDDTFPLTYEHPVGNIDTEKRDYDVEELKTIVPFLTMCFLILSPGHEKSIFSIDALSERAESMAYRGVPSRLYADIVALQKYVQKYVTDNRITFEMLTKYLFVINEIIQRQSPHFTLTYMYHYYIFQYYPDIYSNNSNNSNNSMYNNSIYNNIDHAIYNERNCIGKSIQFALNERGIYFHTV